MTSEDLYRATAMALSQLPRSVVPTRSCILGADQTDGASPHVPEKDGDNMGPRVQVATTEGYEFWLVCRPDRPEDEGLDVRVCDLWPADLTPYGVSL